MNCPSCGALDAGGLGAACPRCGVLLPGAVAPDAARCAVHPEVAAAGTCARCGTFGCAACFRNVGGQAYCEKCASFASDLPWDRRGELGTLKAWWLTSWRLMGSPGAALEQARSGASMGSSMFFAAIAVLAGLMPTFLFYAAMFAVGGMGGMFKELASARHEETLSAGLMVGFLVGYAVLAVVMSLAMVMIFALVDHLGLSLLGGPVGTLDVSVRANALALAPYVLGLIPVCGVYVFGVWSVVLRIIALSSLHKLSGGKAAAVVLSQIALCCGVAFGVPFLIGIMAGISGAHR